MKRIFIDLGSMFWPCWHSAKEHDEAWQNTLTRIEQIVAIVADGELRAVSILADSPRNWRHEIDPGYKSNRKDKPPEAIVQLGKAHSALEKLYRVVLVNGYEADDLAATAARKWSRVGSGVHLVTCDKDWMQLLGEGVRIFNSKAGTMGLEFGAEFTPELVKRASGVRPDQVRDYLGLMGDASDCISGVPGIGKVTAGKLLATHDTAQGILTWADGADEGDKIAAKFRDPAIREMFSTSLRLATLRNDAEVDEWFYESASGASDAEAEDEPEQPPFVELGDEIREPVNERAAIAPPIQQPVTTRETKRETKMDNERSTNGSSARPVPAATKSRFQVVRGATTLPSATILTGRSGIGKTWFASDIPDRFFICVEQGLTGIPVSKLMEIERYEKPRSFGELCAMTEEVIAMAPKHKALVIDTMSGVEKLINKAACQRESVAHMEAKEYAKVWAAAMPFHQEYQELLDKARNAGMQVWVIAHSAEVTEMTDDGETFSKWDLYMQGSGKALINSRSLWRNWADHVFFLDWDARVKKGTNMGQKSIGQYKSRILRTRETPRYYAKTRSGLPEILPATYEDVRRAFAGSNATTTEKLKAKLAAVISELSDADREAMQDQVSAVGNDQGKISSALSRAEGMLSAANEEE